MLCPCILARTPPLLAPARGQVRCKDMAWKKLKYVMLWSRDDLLPEILNDLVRWLSFSRSIYPPSLPASLAGRLCCVLIWLVYAS